MAKKKIKYTPVEISVGDIVTIYRQNDTFTLPSIFGKTAQGHSHEEPVPIKCRMISKNDHDIYRFVTEHGYTVCFSKFELGRLHGFGLLRL